uniref:Transmembrane protein 244 isoform X3 n=1 Tax=Camelus bactrianus TaxID=9837 RepID=A0A9W3GKL6_CAMBA|nr:transmembrane protein 244 isoform X3 [Camelus bactrianus]
MALQVRVAPSKVVLQNLLLCVILFYTVYYVVLGMCSVMFNSFRLNRGHLLHLRIAFRSGCGRVGLGLWYFSNYSPCCHHFHWIRLNFNDLWRPDFSILFVQRQFYLSRSG